MSNWNNIQLGEIIEVKNGYAFKSKDFIEEGIPVIKIKNVKPNKILLDVLSYVSEDVAEGLDSYLIKPTDILITMSGNRIDGTPDSWVGKVALFKKTGKFLLNQRVSIIRVNEQKASTAFIAYYLSSWQSQLHLINQANSSGGQANISPDIIKDYEINLPPLEEQISIANILNSIDNKVDLLQRQNVTLEKMADALYRQVFIEDADSSWEKDKLENVANVQNGYAFSSKDYVPFQISHLEVLKMGHIERGGGLKANPKKDYVPRSDKLKKWILNKGDIIMAMTDMKDNVVILGVPAMIDKDDKYVLNQRVARISLNESNRLTNIHLLYIQLKDSDFISTLQSKANSGVQVNLSTEAIKESEIIIPPFDVQNNIGKTISALYTKKEKNDGQIQTLTKLRDTLLPKLMSGEITVES